MEKKNKMETMHMQKLVINMSLPLIVSLLVQSLYNIVDSIFVAKMSEEALTATSLAFPVQMLMIAFSVGTSVGVNALLSKTLGARNRERATKIANTSIMLALINGAVFSLTGIFFAQKLARSFTTVESTAALCAEYLSICMVFCFGNFIETMLQRFLQAAGNTVLSMCSLIAGAVTNIMLDPILIFGLLGFPALGIRGAAIATVIGQWLGAAVALLLNRFCNREVIVDFRRFCPEKEIIFGIYKVGLPNIITQAISSVMVTLVNQILMPLSMSAVAFFGVYYKLQNFLFMPMNGLGQAAIPIVGFNLGAKNPDRIRDCMKKVFPMALGIAVAGTALFQMIPGQLLSLFSPSEEMLKIGIPALRIISWSFVLGAATIISGYCTSGLGYGITTMISTALRQILVLLPCIWLFSRYGGLGNAWYAMWVAEACGVAFALTSLLRQLRKKVRTLEKTAALR